MAASMKRVTILVLFCLRALSSLSQTTPQNDTKKRSEKVEDCLPPPVLLKGESIECTTLAQRMAELHISGVSIAVVHHGVLEWARGYGVASIGGDPVTPETLFQAGSISKPVAAMAALHLVQQGKLALDTDINAKLKTWKVPESSAAPGATVTLRELLTHTAGFTVHGFPGYAATDSVPTLVQVLNGEKPANTPAIRLEALPGSKWNYSGGGYTVMQQLLIDVSGKPFPELLHDTVLAPIGMTHSTYEQPLPEELRSHAATPYQSDGQPVPGGAHTYRELAAAGLWTTPSDIARYIIENQRSLQSEARHSDAKQDKAKQSELKQGDANHVLSRELTEEMLTSGKGSWGLGVQMGGSPSNPYFSHGGVNAGFESLMVGYEQGGEGAVVMTNAQGGERLAQQVMQSIAVAYNWPDFQPAVRTQVAVAPSVLPRYVGTYQAAPGFTLTFTLEDGQLMMQATGQPKLPAFPESPTRFFLKAVDVEIEFFNGDKGQVDHLILYQNGQEHNAPKTN